MTTVRGSLRQYRLLVIRADACREDRRNGGFAFGSSDAAHPMCEARGVLFTADESIISVSGASSAFTDTVHGFA